MVGKKSDLGPSGIAVSANARRIRESRRLTYAELSRMLAEAGREIPPLGLRRIESGERRVDADDLVALAIALGVTPATLLMPHVATESVKVEVTGSPAPVRAVQLWNWLVARNQLDDTDLPSEASSEEAAAAFLSDMAWVAETHPDWMVGGIVDAVSRGLSEKRARTVLESGRPRGARRSKEI